MPSLNQSSKGPIPESLRGVPYEDTNAAKPPTSIPVPTKPAPNKIITRLRRPRTSQQFSPPKARSKLHDDIRRDSGLAPSTSSARDSRITLATDVDSMLSVRPSASLPSFRAQQEIAPSSTMNGSATTHMQPQPDEERVELAGMPQIPLMSILTEIPTGSLEDLTMPGQVEFSKRGSMLIGGKKANPHRRDTSRGRLIGTRRQDVNATLSPALNVPIRILSMDEEALSNKVRSMYDADCSRGDGPASEIRLPISNGKIYEEAPDQHRSSLRIVREPDTGNGHLEPGVSSDQSTAIKIRIDHLLRLDSELAGGIEDWKDVSNEDVDRYGFIVPRKLSSQASSVNSASHSPDPPRLQRMSTLLQLASDAPRGERSRLGKLRSGQSPARSESAQSGRRRPTSSQSSYRSTGSNSSRIRSAANRLPHNKDRRYLDEAGDMLTLPPGLADIAEDEEGGKTVDDLKRREWEREEKWRKMGKVVNNARTGGGMVFEFDTRSPKVMERTWKGIPDRWRATAWHAFLTASAKKRKGSLSDEDLMGLFRKLLEQGSPDDVQIDIDVPRTINSHIMFRRRYRGGQRLLFRVLHCMSIYFPDTGYVQGMAALAATLLCYFDEEMTFVMLVRLWQLRGLEQLYRSGFAGLMQALDEFEKHWLGKGDVATKLVRYTILYSLGSSI